ncbi:hypothetical protein Lser_V15G24710 [Lactuca serriola]
MSITGESPPILGRFFSSDSSEIFVHMRKRWVLLQIISGLLFHFFALFVSAERQVEVLVSPIGIEGCGRRISPGWISLRRYIPCGCIHDRAGIRLACHPVVKHFIAGSIVLKDFGSLLFIFSSKIGAFLLAPFLLNIGALLLRLIRFLWTAKSLESFKKPFLSSLLDLLIPTETFLLPDVNLIEIAISFFKPQKTKLPFTNFTAPIPD